MQATDTNATKTPTENNSNKKYRRQIYMLLVIGIFLTFITISSNAKDVLYLIFLVYIIYWDTLFYKSWKQMGKENGWLVGLVLLLPLGPLWAFLVARNVYIKNNLW